MEPRTDEKEISPKLSVVIPTLGRPILLQTVESLSKTGMAGELDVVVAGKIHDDHLLSEVENLSSAFARIIILPVSFPAGDSSRKKNAGLEESKADIVAFLDDDVVVANDWPSRVLEAFDRPEAGLMSGPGLIPDDLPVMARLAGMTLASKAAGYVSQRYVAGRSGPRETNWSGLIGCNMAYRKEVLMAIGGFDPAFWPGEDMLAAFRATRLGHKLVFHPGAQVYHYPRVTFFHFLRQIYGYGATRIRLIRAGVELEPTTIVPGIWVLSLLVLGIGSFFSPIFGYLLAANIALYALLCLWMTLDKVCDTRRPVDFLIFFLIPLMHISYGIAEWIELFRPGKDLSKAPAA